MTDTFRALCAEIIDAHDADEGMSVSRWTANLSAVINRARAALAQSEPVAPTDEEIMELMPQQMRDDLATAPAPSWTPIGRRSMRRPKPPSLKEQALAALEDDDIDVYLIRRALGALPND